MGCFRLNYLQSRKYRISNRDKGIPLKKIMNIYILSVKNNSQNMIKAPFNLLVNRILIHTKRHTISNSHTLKLKLI